MSDAVSDLPWLIYGANGHTGHRIAQQAVLNGYKPILAGRKTREIERLARELKCPHRIFSLDNIEQTADQLTDVKAVLNCAGPFVNTAVPMLDACLAAKVDYLDISGEIPSIEAAVERHDRALEAGVSLVPASAFEMVPADCLAAQVAAKLPSADRLQVAFTAVGRISPGTARTIVTHLPTSGRVRRGGKLENVPIAFKSMDISFPTGMQHAATFGTADLITAWHTTGIPNIEAYAAMPPWQTTVLKQFSWMGPVIEVGAFRDMAAMVLQKTWTSQAPRSDQDGRVFLWARAYDPQEKCVEAVMETIEAYRFTVLVALAAMAKMLAGNVPKGFHTPSKAYGVDFAESIPGTQVIWVKQP
jgi:short subunit dehydrogenase-like uncharacterized protein